MDVLCLHWLDSYDVLFRLHLSAYFLLHVLNDRVTFYDMHSSVFNIEVLPSSHLFICYTRLLFFQPLISDTILTALSPGVKGWHHPCSRGQWLVSDNIITPRDRFSRRPNCVSMYKLLLSILSQTHKARKPRTLHLYCRFTSEDFMEVMK